MKILITVLMSLYLSAVDINNLIGNFDTSYKEKSMVKKPKSTTFNKKMMMPSKPQNSSDMQKMMTKKKIVKMKKMENKANNDIKMQKQLISKEEILEASFKQTKEYIESFYIIIIASLGFLGFFIFIYIVLATMKKVSLENQIIDIQEIMAQERNKDMDNVIKHDRIIEEVRQLKLNLSSLKNSMTQQMKNTQTSKPSNNLDKEPEKENNDFAFDNIDNYFDDNHNDMDEQLNLNKNKAPTNNKPTVGDLSNMDLDIATEPKKTKKQKTKIEDMEEFNIDDFD